MEERARACVGVESLPVRFGVGCGKSAREAWGCGGVVGVIGIVCEV